MKKILDFLNENLHKNYKGINDFARDVQENKVDMKVVAETLYQYINYQESIDKIDINKLK